MRRTSLLAVSFILAALFAGSALAQAGAAQPGVARIGWINTGAFGDEKDGVIKYINAVKALQAEMKPRLTELQTLDAKIKTIADELQKMQSNPAIPVKQETAVAKQEEGQRMQRELEFKKKEYDAAVDDRSSKILGPVSSDINKAIQDYAKQKGYGVILDIAALANAGAVLAFDPSADITKEFITYFNARPATTATTAVPKP